MEHGLIGLVLATVTYVYCPCPWSSSQARTSPLIGGHTKRDGELWVSVGATKYTARDIHLIDQAARARVAGDIARCTQKVQMVGRGHVVGTPTQVPALFSRLHLHRELCSQCLDGCLEVHEPVQLPQRICLKCPIFWNPINNRKSAELLGKRGYL